MCYWINIFYFLESRRTVLRKEKNGNVVEQSSLILPNDVALFSCFFFVCFLSCDSHSTEWNLENFMAPTVASLLMISNITNKISYSNIQIFRVQSLDTTGLVERVWLPIYTIRVDKASKFDNASIKHTSSKPSFTIVVSISCLKLYKQHKV